MRSLASGLQTETLSQANTSAWLSDLAAVDGCLLLDHKFSLSGFGVEI